MRRARAGGRWVGVAVMVRARARLRRSERGQISVLVLGVTVVVIMLVLGTVAVTSAQLSRIRMIDAADAAAVAAADALDAAAYDKGLGDTVPVSTATVRRAATAQLAAQPVPSGIERWALASGTGSPDGETAVVVLTGRANLPLVGPLLDGLGSGVSITVTARARAGVEG